MVFVSEKLLVFAAKHIEARENEKIPNETYFISFSAVNDLSFVMTSRLCFMLP